MSRMILSLLFQVTFSFVLFAQSERKLRVTPDIDTLSTKAQSFYLKADNAISLGDNLNVEEIREGLFKVHCTFQELAKIQEEAGVTFVQKASRIPKTEAIVRGHNFGINSIWAAKSFYPDLKGSGATISIKEDAYDTEDLDIANRASTDQYTSTLVDRHATEMASLAAGSGNSYLTGLGVAPEASLLSASFSNLMPEPTEYYTENTVWVQNHSYGVGIENFYGVESVAYDQLAFDAPNLVHSFSVGNDGFRNGTGKYAEIASYGTITGSFKQAKNLIVSTSTDAFGNISERNSRGPAYDGRIKPDLVAYGGEGTSESAALVSGGVVALQERHAAQQGTLPSSDLVRALLIAGADDMLQEGPDFISGYGEFNLLQSLRILDSAWFRQSTVTENQELVFNVAVPSNTEFAKFVLVWNDPPAAEGQQQALINDLDLEVFQNGEGTLPWILNSSANLASLQLPATRGEDHLNNVELVTIDDPQGNIEVRVSGFAIQDSQSFSLVYSFVPEGFFEFTFPNMADAVAAGSELQAYWNTEIRSGNLAIQYDEDGNWVSVVDNLDLSAGYFQIPTIENRRLGRLRMTTTDSTYYSETFQISKPSTLEVDLNCENQLILKWANQFDAEYEVKVYASDELQTLVTTMDTIASFERDPNTEIFYTVQPTRGGQPLLPSFLINVDQQNTGCYINSFLSIIEEDAVSFEITLSGLSEVEEAFLSRTNNEEGEMTVSQLDLVPNQRVTDLGFGNGLNTYQLEITTKDGSKFSSTLDVFKTRDAYIPFPSVVTDGFFNLLAPTSSGTIRLYNSQGSLILSQEIVSEVEFVEVIALRPGVYQYVIEGTDSEAKGRIIIR